MKKAVQYFTKEYLESCKDLSAEQIIEWLDNYRQVQSNIYRKKSKLISMKVPPELLEAFKFRCEREKVPYQTKIKELMANYLKDNL